MVNVCLSSISIFPITTFERRTVGTRNGGGGNFRVLGGQTCPLRMNYSKLHKNKLLTKKLMETGLKMGVLYLEESILK
jgi:hypothetical protein